MDKDLFADFRGNRKPSSGKPGRSNPNDLKELVGEPRADDGLDPRLEARRRARQARTLRLGRAHGEHKQAQLFSQVKEAIDSALLGAGNPLLNALSAFEVRPNGGAMVVVVQPRDPGTTVEGAAATQALEAARSMLRREVAEAISRKETPALQFVVLPTNPGHQETGQ